MNGTDVAVFVEPFSRRNERDRLFDPSSQPDAGDNAFEPFAYLRRWLQQRGVEVHTADLLDARPRRNGMASVYMSFGGRHRYRHLAGRSDVVLSTFFVFECPAVLPTLYADLQNIGREFKRVFTFSTQEALSPFLRGTTPLTRFMLPQSFDQVHASVWERRERRFLVMVSGNKRTSVDASELYTERLRALAFFDRYGEIDLYGRDWEGPAIRMATRMPRRVARLERRARAWWETLREPTDPLWASVRSTYRGPAVDKAVTLGSYSFAVCFENSILDGWITEKIFDCFYAGTVPIYLGAPDVEQWIPSECFIDMRRFAGYDELREYLHGLTDDEVEAYRVAARDFVGSERFRPFSKRTFAERVGQIVEEDAGVSL